MEATQRAYQQYTRGTYFREVSRRVKARDGHRCTRCGKTKGLQAHHNTYEHRGHELEHLGDLTTLCHRCHIGFHVKVGIWVGHGKPRRKLVLEPQAPKPPKAERFPPVPPPEGLEVAGSSLVTLENRKGLNLAKPLWHWLKGKGFDPTAKGWSYRLIGWHVPNEFFQINPQLTKTTWE